MCTCLCACVHCGKYVCVCILGSESVCHMLVTTPLISWVNSMALIASSPSCDQEHRGTHRDALTHIQKQWVCNSVCVYLWVPILSLCLAGYFQVQVGNCQLSYKTNTRHDSANNTRSGTQSLTQQSTIPPHIDVLYLRGGEPSQQFLQYVSLTCGRLQRTTLWKESVQRRIQYTFNILILFTSWVKDHMLQCFS